MRSLDVARDDVEDSRSETNCGDCKKEGSKHSAPQNGADARLDERTKVSVLCVRDPENAKAVNEANAPLYGADETRQGGEEKGDRPNEMR